MKELPLVAVAVVVAATLAVTFDSGEAYGVASPLAIVLPTGGDGSVAIVCGILASYLPRSIQCSTVSSTAGAGEAFDISPNVTYISVSSGRDTICGLQSDGAMFFCWRVAQKGKGYTLRNVYQNHAVAIGDLAVGERQQVVTTDRNNTLARWRRHDPIFPATGIPGRFRSLTSGKDFFCAINDEDRVVCWGHEADNMHAVFEDLAMSSIVSGESHMCGITKEGRLICGGNDDDGQSSPPDPYMAFEFTSLALGSTHTCAAHGAQLHHSVVCWGAGLGQYSPTNDMEYIYLVANGNLTCGVRMADLAVLCWWTSRDADAPAKVVQLPLRREVVYGLCVPRNCPCGEYLLSFRFCADSHAICQPCASSEY